MKKIITVVTALILFFNSMSGQKNAIVEISAGSGVWSSDELFDGYSPGLFGPSFRTYITHSYSGAFYATVKYFVSKRASLGIAFAYENERGDWQKNINIGGAFDWERIPLGTFKRQAFTFAPELYVNYAEKGMTRIYSTAGVGVTYRNEVDRYSDSYYESQYNNGTNPLGPHLEANNNKLQGNFYYSPLGLSIGRTLRWFAEIGIGYKGILNTGLSYKI